MLLFIESVSPLTDPLIVLGILSLNVAIADWLVRRTFCRHFGTALLVILITAIFANLGIIPTSANETPIYGLLLGDVAQLAIFWILLQVNLRALLKAGAPMIIMFLIGSLGTFLGVLAGMWAVNGSEHFAENYIGLSAMFTGTYTGGSINFNAMAIEYNVSEASGVYTGAVAVDNIFTALWMMVTLAIPRSLSWLRERKQASTERGPAEVITGVEDDTETIHPLDLGLIFALGAAAVFASGAISDWIRSFEFDSGRISIPSILFLTTFALIFAQFPLIQRLRGTRAMGMFAVYLFLATIGALCDLSTFGGEDAAIAVRIFFFVMILIFVHGVIVFGVGRLARVDEDVVAVASQANIGGGTSALALARSLGRADLVLPAILVGSLGTALGNFLGVLTATVLR